MTSLINSILTNTTAIAVRNNLNSSNNSLAKSIERLSSGFKINCAKDGATECAISTKTNIQLSGLNTANQNAMQGINMLNVAEDALENMGEKTMRIRDLVLKTLNSTYSDDELDAIQNEINQLSEEIKREKETTVYNKKKIFDTAISKTQEVKPPEKPYAYEVEYIESTGTQYIDTGYIPNEKTEINASVAFLENSSDLKSFGCITKTNDIEGYNRWHFGINRGNLTALRSGDATIQNGGDVVKTYDNEFHNYYLSDTQVGIDENIKTYTNGGDVDVSFTLFARNGYTTPSGVAKVQNYAKSRLESMTIKEDGIIIHDYIPVIDKEGNACLYDKISNQMLYSKGSGEFLAGDIIQQKEKEQITTKVDNFTTLQIGQDAGKDNIIDIELGFDLKSFELDVKSRDRAKEAIQKCDDLIKMFSMKKCKIGSSISRINSICDLQNKEIENLSQAKSLITDTDIASETTKFAQTQIMKDISSSLLIHANQITNNLALKLLKIQSYPM